MAIYMHKVISFPVSTLLEPAPGCIPVIIHHINLSVLPQHNIIIAKGRMIKIIIWHTFYPHLVIHRSSCVIDSRHYSLCFSAGLIVLVCCDTITTFPTVLSSPFSPSSLSHTSHLPLHHLHQFQQHLFYLRTLNLAITVEFHIVQYLILPPSSTTSPTWGTSPTRNNHRTGLGHHRACL